MEVPGPEEVTQNTTDFYTNPHYNATIFTNDIAVIKLNTTVTFSGKFYYNYSFYLCGRLTIR